MGIWEQALLLFVEMPAEDIKQRFDKCRALLYNLSAKI